MTGDGASTATHGSPHPAGGSTDTTIDGIVLHIHQLRNISIILKNGKVTKVPASSIKQTAPFILEINLRHIQLPLTSQTNN